MKNCLLFLVLFLALPLGAQNKREFRGAWIQIVNGQFQGMGTEQMKSTLSYQLNELRRDGVNAIIFQVRAECDALYPSPYEPWSRFLTGTQGQVPSPYWDPLEWMVDECHRRGMELHAWINPYRAKTKSTGLLAANHVGVADPERTFSYDQQLILNPGLPANRDYICRVAADIVRRYDIDGFHIDDYFYPYPAAGLPIPDQETFRQYNNGFKNIADWRRDNVNLFIRQLNDTIHSIKPWVKFGVSPFGIYRNKKQDPLNGSDTNGLSNYDDLYADVLFWINKGWVDYTVPQIYWEIGNKAADYRTLITWWNRHAAGRPLFIGEDIVRTAKFADPANPASHQLPAKHKLHQQMRNVKGTVLWYAKAAVDNVGNIGSTLRDYYWKYPALMPAMPFIDGKAPKKPRKLKLLDTEDGPVLFWTAPKGRKWDDVAAKYVVYRFGAKEHVDLEDASKIVEITHRPMYRLPASALQGRSVYVVTALDRMSNESKGAKRKVRF